MRKKTGSIQRNRRAEILAPSRNILPLLNLSLRFILIVFPCPAIALRIQFEP
jgi:hypothetical protein